MPAELMWVQRQLPLSVNKVLPEQSEEYRPPKGENKGKENYNAYF